MSHKGSRIDFGASAHLKDSCLLVFIVLDENHVFADMKIDDISDAGVNGVFLALPVDQSDPCL